MGGLRRLPIPLRRRGPGQVDDDILDVAVDVAGVRLSTWARRELLLASPNAVMQAMTAIGRFSSHAWVHEIDVPTAVVVTTLDRMIAPDRQLKLARAIPGATIHPAHAGHSACVVSARKFVPALVEACQTVGERAATSPGPLRLTAVAGGRP
jgi:pimeloyl-ACP methyl ester carboxylesterase